MEVLDWLGLAAQAHRKVGTLPFGEERRVGIARAVAMAPQFLLMDEPAAGLNDAECEDLQAGRPAASARELDCGILLIEHRMSLVFALCDRIQVLQQGRTIAIGPPDEIRADADGARRPISAKSRSEPCWRSRISMSATATSSRCAASRSRSARARSSPSSARTAPASRHCC